MIKANRAVIWTVTYDAVPGYATVFCQDVVCMGAD